MKDLAGGVILMLIVMIQSMRPIAVSDEELILFKNTFDLHHYFLSSHRILS